MTLLASAVPRQQASKPVPQASATKALATRSAKTAAPNVGSISDGVYRNSYFGVSYKVPFGWVDRTQDMQPEAGGGQGLVLLAIFERPPEAQGETVNSAVVIAAEPRASYPGLKSAADYFGPLTELATGKGFKVVHEPYEFSIGARPLVRSDFTKTLGKQAMQQTTLAEMQKGYFVSFTFIGAGDDELDELIGGLSLGTAASSHGPKGR